MAKDIEVHADETASVLIDVSGVSDDGLFALAWKWFSAKSPEDRASVVIRAFLDRSAWEGEGPGDDGE